MKIAFNHLREHLIQKPSIGEVSDKLFQLGHEHEIQNGIFNMEFTPNRGDCFSLEGILRDLAVFYDIDLKRNIYGDNLDPLSIDFINNAQNDCSSVSFLKIEIEGKIGGYNKELENYFSDLNINKNNIFTDISNYISYEIGQPTHCYDLSNFPKQFSLENIEGEFIFNTLLDKKVTLKDKNLVFTNKNNILNLAGIMGGKDTSCSQSTVSALIECAYFNPEAILGKSVKYDIKSEAAHKFERGVDPSPLMQERALRRFIYIVKDYADIKNIEFCSYSPMQNVSRIIDFDISIINKIIGIKLSEDEYKKYLLKLGFIINQKHIEIPSYRSDINNQNDLAEEIARVVGYDNLPSKKIKIINTKVKKEIENQAILKSILINNGFYEVINDPFVPDLKESKSIKVDNPLDSNRKFLRTNLKYSLTNNLLYNERRQKDSIKLFEIAEIYTSVNSIQREKVLGIIASGRVGKNHQEFSKKIDLQYLSKILENYFSLDALKNIAPISRENMNTKIKNPIVYFEINLNNIILSNTNKHYSLKPPTTFSQYKPISEFPSSYRDLSISIKDPSKLKKVQILIAHYENELLKESFLFDYFNNKKINEIKLGYRFIFQSRERTITEKEVSLITDDIIMQIISINGVSIPGI